MKYLQTKIPWDNIKAVGFDMDGTLYDEFDFIYQVYNPIAAIFSNSHYKSDVIKKIMLEKWIEKGSSYPYIFSETADIVGWNNEDKKNKISDALTVFRNYEPVINVRNRIKFILELFKDRYELFVVSDGSSKLQWNKVKALQLTNYFAMDNIFISGDYGTQASKPNVIALNHLAIFRTPFNSNEVVFIGDRNVDSEFAKNAGFYYIDIKEML